MLLQAGSLSGKNVTDAEGRFTRLWKSPPKHAAFIIRTAQSILRGTGAMSCVILMELKASD